MKTYTSFDEINRDIRVYDLQRQIAKEEMKISFHHTKEAATPSKLVTGTLGALATSSLILKLLSPLIPYALGKIVGKRK